MSNDSYIENFLSNLNNVSPTLPEGYRNPFCPRPNYNEEIAARFRIRDAFLEAFVEGHGDSDLSDSVSFEK